MAPLEPAHPKVLISYSHDSPEHKDRVLHLSDRLRADGIDCKVDQYETSPPEGWPRWMVNQIEEADFVLVVCTETYERRFKGKEDAGKGLGGKWEGAVITQELYTKAKNTNFIPVLFSPKDATYIPIVLSGATHYEVNTQEGYESLYRRLTDQPFIQKPELGKLRAMPSRERKQDFLDAPWNVPYPRNPFFTGREQVLEQLHEALKSGKTAALSQTQAISGLGGIGKTQTAIEYAYRYRDEYKAVLWTKADSSEALVSDFVSIANLLNLPEKDEKDQNLSVAAMKLWLEINTGWLLILDNADTPNLVEGFLPLNPKGHILLTSRAQVFDNLGITNPLELDKMQPDEAKQFLLKRTGRSELEPADTNAVEQLAKELDYLPLALEQAGAYINKVKCSFQDYLTSYRKRGLELLEQSKVMTGKYPKSVATTWSLNFEQVAQTSTASADLLHVSVFLNPYSIPLELITVGAVELGSALPAALANVESDPLALDELLEPLTQYSLIRRDYSSRTYSIHRMVQAVLKDGIDSDTQRLWAECTVRAVNSAFPNVWFSKWHLCERLLSQALACAELIEKWSLEFKEAARLLDEAGKYLYERARFDEAERLIKQSLAIREKTLGQDNSNVADSFHNLAVLYYEQGKFGKAEQLYNRALEIREKVLKSDHPDIAKNLNSLGTLYRNQGKFAEAEQFYKRALEIRERILDQNHPDIAESLNSLGLLYDDQGKFGEAEQLHKRALEIREKVLEPNHPDVANSLHNLASLYQEQGKYSKAEPLYMRALKIIEETKGLNHPNVASILNNLAMLYSHQGKFGEAEELLKKALEIREKVLGQDHPDVANSLNNLAMLYHDQGKYIKAKPIYMQAIMIIEKSLGQDHPDLAIFLKNYADLLRKINRNREAAKIDARAKAIRAKLAALEYSIKN